MDNFLLEKHNPWWKNKKEINKDVVLRDFNNQKYKYFHPFLKNIPHQDSVIIIRGPRRIGKTTLLKLSVKKLLKNKKSKNVFFYPCDRIEDHNQLYNLLTLYLGKNIAGRKYVFLDEISFVKQWQRTIKSLWDSADLKDCVLILTGSSALDLKFSSERLPGRRGKASKVDINYLPLSFNQFLETIKAKQNKQKLFKDYLLCGGFPEAINEFYKNNFIPNRLYEIYLTWIEGDLYKIGKSEKILYAIIGEVFKHLGSRTSWYKIAKNTGTGSHSTVQDYIDNLEKMFVVFLLHFYSLEQKKIYLNKNKKFYFFDPIIFHAFRAKVDNFTDRFFNYSQDFIEKENLSALIENVVANSLYRRSGKIVYGNYQQKEIDFVWQHQGENYPFEVKYRENINLSNFSFWQEKKPLTVITKDFTFEKDNLKFIKVEDFLQRNF